MYVIVIATILTALAILLGFFYRLSILLFFICFTYLELIDKTWYLNHYYLISIISFIMLFLPANQAYSLDNKRKNKPNQLVPKWAIVFIRLQIAIVYFFAGIAKLKYDWLVLAQPMKIWLNARSETAIIGPLFSFGLTPYIFSWFALIYDLTIPFFLINKKTRKYAYLAVIVFHIMTYLLFNLGMFPWVMILLTLVFFEEDELKIFFKKPILKLNSSYFISKIQHKFIFFLFSLHFLIQVFLPLRHFLYSGNVLWNEKGFRFAWHVMLMEKNGFCKYCLLYTSPSPRDA